MVEFTEMKLRDDCAAWVRDFKLLDEQEQNFIVDLTNTIAHGFRLTGIPAFLLEMEEHNRTTGELAMHFKLAHVTPEGTCLLGIMMPETLFQTTAKQKYHATNHHNSKLDYDGELRIKLTFSGVWDDKTRCHTQNEIAEYALTLASGCYYERILWHFPEWDTDYRNAPLAVTQEVEHL